MKFRLLLIKRLVEDIGMFPLILFGRLLATFNPLKKEFKVFYFFPFYHTGGAEKVHALITKATGGKNCIIFFTRRSHNDAFYQKFKESGCEMRDISKYTDNKWLYFVNIIYRGMISGYINGQTNKPIIFNGQCNFGYKLSPWINKSIRQIELIHSVSNFSYIRIPFLPFIDKTVMISKQKITEHLALYKKFSIPESFADRIHYIPNASSFQEISPGDKDHSKVSVLYSGRATVEKRPYLVTRIAEEVHKRDASIEFTMAGDDFDELPKDKLPFVNFAGNITDERRLNELYFKSTIVLITSSTEGFPLAVIEGMAYGCAIIATPVGDIPVHVKQKKNGILLSSVDDEDLIVREAVEAILRLKNDPDLTASICRNNIAYAQANFTYERFANDYNKILFA